MHSSTVRRISGCITIFLMLFIFADTSNDTASGYMITSPIPFQNDTTNLNETLADRNGRNGTRTEINEDGSPYNPVPDIYDYDYNNDTADYYDYSANITDSNQEENGGMDIGVLVGNNGTDNNPGFCNVPFNMRFPTTCLPCFMTEQYGCPNGASKVSEHACGNYGEDDEHCLYLCEIITDRSECCTGFWGKDCLPCPSTLGLSNDTEICNGKGTCADGIDGNGNCTCMSAFKGTACELCELSDEVYGPDCNQRCDCDHGVCDSDRTGTGACFCEHGYGGEKCDTQIHCLEHLCGENAHCTDATSVSCVCDRGFMGDGQKCRMIDMCSMGICSDHANCTMHGPANYTCKCMAGYHGDGFYCMPVDHCQIPILPRDQVCPYNNTECKYEGPGQFSCPCIRGFIKSPDDPENRTCVMKDMCESNPCHANANCSMIGPLVLKCICHDGYVGDGFRCHGNFLHTLNELNTYPHSDLRNTLNGTIKLFSAASDILQAKGRLTIFAPLTVSRAAASWNQHKAAQFVRQHIIPIPLNAAFLRSRRTFFTLEGTAASLSFNPRRRMIMFKLPGYGHRARVIKTNVIASNGYIHFINQILEKPPVINYKPRQTLLTQIQSDGRFNRLESLVASAGLQDILNDTSRNLTLFAPNNKAWDTLPLGTVQYLQSKDGKGKLKALLENHIIPDIIQTSDLLDTNRLATMANNIITVRINQKGQFKLNKDVAISQTDIPAINGVFHHIDRILIPESIEPLLPHVCNETREEEVAGLCGPCTETLHCPLTSDIPDTTKVPIACTFTGRNRTTIRGCAQSCKRRSIIKKCCPNFFGPDCRPCPGGHLSACGGRGTCNDGINGTGMCSCQSTFKGTVCQLCVGDKFGSNCEKDCTCLQGKCDSTVTGNGHCILGSCPSWRTGKDCELRSERCGLRSVYCHIHAECALPGNSTHMAFIFSAQDWFSRSVFGQCQCSPGYRGDGVTCAPINRCEDADNGGCHEEADCIYVGPAANNCTCRSGWVGDGTYCYASTSCSGHHNCDENAQCSANIPGEYTCKCMENYHGDGIRCVPINACDHDNGGCHRWATCTPRGPGKKSCTCQLGYAGDGISCFGNLWDEIQANNFTTSFASLLNVTLLPKLLSNFSGQYTILVPKNGFQYSSEIPDLSYLKYHILQGRHDVHHLRTLVQTSSSSNSYFMSSLAEIENNEINITYSGSVLLINSVLIFSANHFALNGIIHIMENDLHPLQPYADLDDLFSNHGSISQFYHDLQQTGLDRTIQRRNVSGYTIFAVENEIWKPKVKQGQLQKYISYYIIPQQLSMETLVTRRQISSLQGVGPSSKLNISSRNEKVFVNGYLVHDDRLRTERGYVYKLMSMLHPNLNRCDKQRVDGSINAQCCEGFYGFDCLECPGGSINPCNNHGICDQTLSGLGLCTCHPGFTGADCDTCAVGYKGPQCHLDMCTLCDVNAICLTSASVSCVCDKSYVGDGFKCIPKCQEKNGGCDINAECSTSNITGEVTCLCKEAYHGTGKNCSQIFNLCNEFNGGCSENAICIFNPPRRDSIDIGSVKCTCKTNYTGNGTVCNGDLLSTLQMMNETRDFYQAIADLMEAGNNYENTIKNLFSKSAHGITVFVPVNWLDANDTESQIVDVERHVVEEYILLNASTLEDNDRVYLTASGENITIQNPSGNLSFVVNGTLILQTNIPSTNGIIHLIMNPLMEKIQTEPLTQKGNQAMSMVPYIIAALILIVIIVIVAAFIIAKRRSEWPRFSRHIDSDESEFSFKILNGFDTAEPSREEMLDASSVFKNPLYDRLADTS